MIVYIAKENFVTAEGNYHKGDFVPEELVEEFSKYIEEFELLIDESSETNIEIGE